MGDHSIKRTLQDAIVAIKNMNLFPSSLPSDDPVQLRSQIISTRIFALLFILSLSILLSYMAAIEFNKMVTVSSPTLEQYDFYYNHYSQTLICPCQHVSFDHSEMISIGYTLHQVCSSDFISDQWLLYLYEIYEWWRGRLHTSLHIRAPVPRDFRSLSPFMFQALSGLCVLSNRTIATGLMQFYTSKYTSLNLIARSPFRSQTLLLMNNFKTSTARKFLSSMSVIGDVIQVNNLLPSVDSSFDFIAGLFGGVDIRHRVFDGCSCLEKQTCVVPSTVDNTRYNGSIYYIPNFYYGCYALNSLLTSSLDCFYDQACFDGLVHSLERALEVNIKIMNASILSRFPVNTPVQALLDELMVEEWNWASQYERYFNACRPIECRYTNRVRNDALEIASAIFGLTGGLISVLRLIVPKLTLLIFKLMTKLRPRNQRQVAPERRQACTIASINEDICAI